MSNRGRRGERIARRKLIARGYRILARNVRLRGGEIDLVAARDGVVVLFEVKTRTAAAGACLTEALTPAQRRRILATGWRWLVARGGRSLPFRLAAVTVRHDPIPPGSPWWRRTLVRLRPPEVRILDPLD